MAKKIKSMEYLGLGIMTILGFIFGLALFLLLYAWYQVGFADYETVLVTAVLLTIVMYVILYLAYLFGKKYGLAYEKAIWLGIGFTVALIVAGIFLSYLGLASPITIGASVLSLPASLQKPFAKWIVA